MPDEADTEHRWSAARWIGLSLILLLTLLVLYVLSVGPAVVVVVICVEFGSHPLQWVIEAFRLVYWPLIDLSGRSAAAEQFFMWYVGLWREMCGVT